MRDGRVTEVQTCALPIGGRVARHDHAPGRVTADGRLSRVKIVDPSFFNWPALPVALTDTIVPDVPLTNKSFNLSYAGKIGRAACREWVEISVVVRCCVER